jgi:hypothetical protein
MTDRSRRLIAVTALSLAVAACSTPPAADCSNPSACYRFDSDGRLRPAYPPQPVEAHAILIGDVNGSTSRPEPNS